jgi:DNA-binding HxlR family transcriptional regulator
MRRQETECPMDALLRLLMGPWTTYILWILRSEGPQRFGELRRKIPGISPKVLTERLRLLESGELIARAQAPTIPPQVTYSLAARGCELTGVMDSLNEISLRWAAEDAGTMKGRQRGANGKAHTG